MDDRIRKKSCFLEHATLSPLAAFSDESRGRLKPEPECPVRTAFQRDRDRIIHCNSFRRLKHKTQVFLSPEGDHYRTRLTHTLEVAQIARTIARGLDLNEDLAEAISLGHDLGHTPFGHAGERALDAVCSTGFHHYRQSLRVVDVLEKDGEGLNLTYEVRNGIVCHTKGTEASTLEGRVVRLADRIAYINHDIDDAVRAGVMRESDIPVRIRETLGQTKSARINHLVLSAIENSKETIALGSLDNSLFEELHDFMFRHVYTNPVCKSEESKAIDMIQWLFGFYMEKPENLPEGYRKIMERDGKERAVCDFVAGMSDRYAVKTFESYFVPQSWMD
ncbi:MAG: deoxyguanosinetriphosphate triphosphohydrolase [Clostridia bacterium]|nr:deoxyguanosinetriphosphate triphosphohydrolase [Clostridia bacterium]